MSKNIKLYKKYFVDNQSERTGLFRALKEKYGCTSSIYPGSFVHVTPSLVFPNTVFVDNDRRVQSFFDDPAVLNWVKEHKEYKDEPDVRGFQQDYAKPLPVDVGTFDLLISQYAGFVSQQCKQYLKPGGILLVNNSHADAGLAFLDTDYELVAVVNHANGKWTLSETKLEEYFVPKKAPHPSKSQLLETMRGVGYTKTPSNYIFKRI